MCTFESLIVLRPNLQLSPHSAFISLKKSPMKDLSGKYLQPSIKHLVKNICCCAELKITKMCASAKKEVSELKTVMKKL